MSIDDERVANIISEIQKYVNPRRIRMREFFFDYDHLRSGRCTKAQFHRALITLGMRELDSQAADILAEYYTQTGPKVEKPQVVNYNAFVQKIDEVFVHGVEPEMSQSPGSTMMSTFIPQSLEDEETLMHVLHRLATMCQTRGVVLRKCFEDFANAPIPSPSRQNPKYGGKCTVNQFLRAFPFKNGEFGENDMNILIERYKTPKGDIHFGALYNEIADVISHEMPSFPTSPLVLGPDNTKWAHHELHPVHKIQSKVAERRIRMQDSFHDFDPLRKGFCTLGQLKTVFTILNLSKEINRDDFETLAYTYMRDDGLFGYSDFCRDVDLAFAKPNLEREPLTVTSMPDFTTTMPARRNQIVASNEQRQKIDALEEKIRTKVILRRILIKPTFRDMDKPNRGFVTKNQFYRCMQMLDFKDITPSEMQLLATRYCNMATTLTSTT
jgi:hypothetical protein